jgi:tetratricopeptide (TPR) repeat protein
MFRSSLLTLIILVGSIAARAQLGSTPTPAPSTDPLAIGKQALVHGDFKAAQEFFSNYLKEHPENTEAIFYAGNSALELRQYDDAASYYRKVIEKQPPNMWPAHKSLVVVYAVQQKWEDFDRERKLIQDARVQGSPGLSPKDADVIDILYVGDERYIVRAYAELAGHFHARYNFTHFNKQGKLDFWISCESDDNDQTFFAQSHPKEAAAGQRSFSLDSYTAAVPNPNGQGMTQTHGTIKFYPDGEPTYETVRADVLKVLEHKSGTMSTTVNTKPNTK